VLSCRELVSRLGDCLDPGSSPTLESAAAGHLDACPDCQAYAASYRTTVALARSVLRETEPGSTDVPEELVEAILASRSIPYWRVINLLSGVAASPLLVFALGS
jgi:hypothetical protein